MSSKEIICQGEELFRLIPQRPPMVMIDRFYGIEETALALLLGFRENKTLDQLAHIRYILQIAMEKQFSNEEYDEIIEQEVKTWKPPYNSSKEELLLMLEK